MWRELFLGENQVRVNLRTEKFAYRVPVLLTLTRDCLVYWDSITSMDLISTGSILEIAETLHHRTNSASQSFARSYWPLSRKSQHRAESRDSCWRQPWPLGWQELTRRMKSANWREYSILSTWWPMIFMEAGIEQRDTTLPYRVPQGIHWPSRTQCSIG